MLYWYVCAFHLVYIVFKPILYAVGATLYYPIFEHDSNDDCAQQHPLQVWSVRQDWQGEAEWQKTRKEGLKEGSC